MKINYKDIYINLIMEKCPDRLKDPFVLWKLEHLDSSMSILDLNKNLFKSEESNFNQLDSRLRSYTEEEIIRILKFQCRYKKTNTEIIKKYGMSRATLKTWQKRFKSLL